jgi:hypothetical protein
MGLYSLIWFRIFVVNSYLQIPRLHSPINSYRGQFSSRFFERLFRNFAKFLFLANGPHLLKTF